MMSLSLPDWMPLWAQLVLLAVLIVFGLGFLMMPFAVFGVKGRLAELELLVQELHADVRAISVRLASAQGVETGSLSRDMFDRPVARSQAVVEEIRPPAPVPAPSAPPVAPVLTSVRAPKVSDAYEPRNEAPPMPQASVEPAGLSARRMPWHDQAPQTVYPEGRTEPLANVIRRDRAPDANQPPYRPDFSKDRDEPQGHRRYDAQTGRTEPMLNWPANTKSSL